ncbi:MAG: MerR family transcriptional regulator [Pseudomonadota bacterium]
MAKQPDAYQTIGEAARALAMPTHVLRFWETKFAALKPRKGAGGRRYYRPEDMKVLFEIRRLLQEEGYTIKGAQKHLAQNLTSSAGSTNKAANRAAGGGAVPTTLTPSPTLSPQTPSSAPPSAPPSAASSPPRPYLREVPVNTAAPATAQTSSMQSLPPSQRVSTKPASPSAVAELQDLLAMVRQELARARRYL